MSLQDRHPSGFPSLKAVLTAEELQGAADGGEVQNGIQHGLTVTCLRSRSNQSAAVKPPIPVESSH